MCVCVCACGVGDGGEMKGGEKGGDRLLVEGMARTRERKAGKYFFFLPAGLSV